MSSCSPTGDAARRAASGSAPWRCDRARWRGRRRRRAPPRRRATRRGSRRPPPRRVGDEREPDERAATGFARPGAGEVEHRSAVIRRRPPRRRRRSSSPRRPTRRVPLGDAIRADGPSASASRSENVRNSRKSNSRLTSSGRRAARQRVEVDASSGASRRSTISVEVLRAPAPRARPARPRSFGVCSSTLAKMPSSPPYVLISLAAVFSPTPGTPGRLSRRVAAQRGVLAGTAPA